MAMRFYKINGQYQSWDYLHDDLGYTQEPSTTTSYKSSASATWGQSIVDSGYNIATDSTDLDTYQFWIENASGWYSASEMAQEGYYPSFATDGPRFVKESELSVSVEISGTGWRDTWYLLKKDVTIGWCTISDLGEHGWEVDRGEIVGGLISATTDKPIYSFGNGGLLVPGAYAYQDGDLLDMTWDFGGMVEEDVPISQPVIGGILTATTDSKFYGDFGGVLELDSVPTALELDVGLRWTWTDDPTTGTWRAIDLSTDDWYYAGLLSQADADRLTAFGLDVKNVDNRSGVIGNVGFDPYYSYKVIAIYSDIVNGQGSGEITFNPSNFYAYNCSNYPDFGFWNTLLLEYSGASGTAKGWRVRIKKIDPTPSIHIAYLNANKQGGTPAINNMTGVCDEMVQKYHLIVVLFIRLLLTMNLQMGTRSYLTAKLY